MTLKWKDPRHYKQSLEKWEGIVKALKTAIDKKLHVNKYLVSGSCGFCLDLKLSKYADPDCSKCPLYPTHCGNKKSAHMTTTFWRCDSAIMDNDLHLALQLAETLLTEIKKHKPAKRGGLQP